MRTESDLIVNKIHLIDHVLADESGTHVIIGVSVGSRAALLEPEESVLDTVDPSGVLGDTLVCVGRGRDLETEFVPISAATACLVCSLSVA